MNITVEQLVQFGRFPYCKGRLNKDDMEHVESAIKLLNLQHIRDRNIKSIVRWATTTCLYRNDNCSRHGLYFIR